MLRLAAGKSATNSKGQHQVPKTLGIAIRVEKIKTPQVASLEVSTFGAGACQPVGPHVADSGKRGSQSSSVLAAFEDPPERHCFNAKIRTKNTPADAPPSAVQPIAACGERTPLTSCETNAKPKVVTSTPIRAGGAVTMEPNSIVGEMEGCLHFRNADVPSCLKASKL